MLIERGKAAAIRDDNIKHARREEREVSTVDEYWTKRASAFCIG